MVPYWCTSFYKVVILSILRLFINQDTVYTIFVEIKPMVCLLKVPYFASSVHKSTKHFGLSFAYDAPKIWNDLPDDLHSTTSLHSFRKKLKTISLQKHTHPSFWLFFLVLLHGAEPCYVSGDMINDFYFSVLCAQSLPLDED